MLSYHGNVNALTSANRVRMGLVSSSPQSSVGRSVISSADKIASQLRGITASNNAWSASQAMQQMQYQTASAERGMRFNADEAAKSRQWQEYMSNTAHQRQVKDLAAAGLNPVLSAMGGSGAAVPSGATASGYSAQGSKGDTDTSATGAIVSLLGSMLDSQTALANQAVSARTQESIADKNNSMSQLIAQIQRQTALDTTTINAMAHKYAADRGASASITSSAISAAAQRYGHDVSAMTQKEIAGFNAAVNSYLADKGYQHDFDIRAAYPNNAFSLAGSIADGLFGDSSSGRGLSSAYNSGKDVLTNLAKSLRRRSSGGGGRDGKINYS